MAHHSLPARKIAPDLQICPLPQQYIVQLGSQLELKELWQIKQYKQFLLLHVVIHPHLTLILMQFVTYRW